VHGGAKVAIAYKERNERYEGVLMAIVFRYPENLK
jgi:hypothetical protein